MYVYGNPASKTELTRRVKAGEKLEIFAPGLGTPERNGIEDVCGPHSPKPHSWYARVEMKDGIIVKVLK